MDERLHRYLNEGGFDAVPGACPPIVGSIFSDLNDIQRQRGVIGDVAEIGVAYGRLITLLALLTRPEECAIAIDVFEVDTNYDPTGGTTTLEIVNKNYKEYVGDSRELKIVIGDSILLDKKDISSKTNTGKIRIFSIDGAHSHFHTASDMLLAEGLIPAGGVVTVDDISNTGWPGVIEGVGRYFLCNASQKLFPFMIGHNKLWLTTHDYHMTYFDYALEHAPLGSFGLSKRVTRFFGYDLVGF